MFKYGCISTVDLSSTNGVEEMVQQYITAFVLSYYYYINRLRSHKQSTLCDISVAITEQSLPQRYLSPGFFTVNKPQDESQHSTVTFYLFTSYFHFSELQVKLIIVYTRFSTRPNGSGSIVPMPVQI